MVAGDLEGRARRGLRPSRRKQRPEAARRQLPRLRAVPGPAGTLDPAVFEELAGFDLLEADRFVANELGERPFTVVMGDLGPDTLPDSLKDVGGRIRSDIDGEDGAANMAREGIDPIGRPVRFAAKKNAIAMSTSTPLVTGLARGRAPTLAEDETLVEVAKALDGEDVFSALLTDAMPMAPDLMATPESAAQQMEALGDAAGAVRLVEPRWKARSGRGRVPVRREPDTAALGGGMARRDDVHDLGRSRSACRWRRSS